jgi:hypothetical protein
LRWAFGALLLARLLFPYFNSPLTHLFSDPMRHWSNGERFLNPDLIGAGDPYLYQLWIYLVRTASAGSDAAVLLSCGVLCAAMPYGWYRALKELLPRSQALTGALIIGLVPGFTGIYAYFMNETLLLALTGFAFWLTLRAWRKDNLAAWTLACAAWTCAGFTRIVALPMAVLCLGSVWLAQEERFEKALIAATAVLVLAVPAGLHAQQRLGFFAPFGNLYEQQIQSLGGKLSFSLDCGAAGWWTFGSPSFYNPTFYPFSSWTTDRRGTVAVKIDLARGRAGWVEARDQAARESPISSWQRHKEYLLYLLFGQSWPDSDPGTLSGLLTLWTRWLWPPVMLYVAWGALRGRFRGREWLLPACALGVLLLLALQSTTIIEGRYRKPIDPILVAAAIILHNRTRRKPAARPVAPATT